MSQEWSTHDIYLDAFRAPEFVDYPVSLDRRRVYRLGILLLGKAPAAHGFIDLDDLRFAR